MPAIHTLGMFVKKADKWDSWSRMCNQEGFGFFFKEREKCKKPEIVSGWYHYQ